MIGWGTALVWGPVADRFGRVRTMMFSILCFSFFTLLSAFSTGVWSLAVFRFLAGIGIGGEWAIGASLVSEDWPEERRTWGGALMHTGYYFGFLFAALANYFIGSHFGWRYMFVVGGVPALLVALIRNNVKEPERWEIACKKNWATKWTMHRAFFVLFSTTYRRRTIFNSIVSDRVAGRAVGRVGVCAVGDDLHRQRRAGQRWRPPSWRRTHRRCWELGRYSARCSCRRSRTGWGAS